MTSTMPAEVKQLLEDIRTRAPLQTVVQWLEELCRLRSLSVKFGLGLHKEHSNIFDQSDGSVGQIGFPAVTILKGCENDYAIGDDISGSCIVFLESPSELIPLDAVGRLIPLHHLPALIVNLAHPDEVIHAEVDRVLREARKEFPTPYLRSGPRPRQLKWSDTFVKWENHRIREFCELLAWRKRSCKQREFPELVLGSWLKLDDKNKTGRAKEVLKNAIASLPMLEAQARHDRGADEALVDQSG